MSSADAPLFTSTSPNAGAVAARFATRRYLKILDYLQEHGPSCLFEVAAHLGVFDHQISGRFTELAARGLIERTGQTKVKPETGCAADVWRLAEQKPREPELADRLGYPASLVIGGEKFDRGIVLGEKDAPGVPYARRADAGGARLNWRVEFVECGGCGRPLKLVVEKASPASRQVGGQDRKTYRCGTPGCNRVWHLELVHEPGQPQLLAIVMKHL